ncbi:MAG: serine/threonine-protein kinase [Myxococcota bacterium]
MVADAKTTKASALRPTGTWKEAVAEIIYGLYAVDRYSLVIAVGSDDQARRVLAAELAAKRPSRAIFREFRLDPGSLNAFEDYTRAHEWRDDYVTLVYGLEGLSIADQRKALRLMNWNRGMLERGNLRVVLWVPRTLEEQVVEHAGDLLDWWTVYVELPAAPEVGSWEGSQASAVGRLAHRYQQRATAQHSGQDTNAIDHDIVRLRRQLRSRVTPRDGDIMGGRYRLLERRGAGGFATVYRAHDTVEGQDVALKLLHAQHAYDRTMRDRFFRGAQRMARLRHPAITRVVSVSGEDHGTHYFVMEYMAKGDLGHAVASRSLTRVQLLEALAEAGEGLAFAHEQGLVHRDVKPSNILIGEDGRARLTDFDLVRAPDTTGGTRTGAMGTVLFAAPETMADASSVGPSADVYSLGMTAVWALADGQANLVQVLREPETLVDDLEADPGLEATLKAALSFEPDARPPLTELVGALRVAAASEPAEPHDHP